MFTSKKITIASIIFLLTSSIFANEWEYRIGVGQAMFDSSAKVSSGGNIIPGLSAEADDNTTLLFDISYKISDNLKARLFGGFPPETTLKKVGDFQVLPDGTELGKVTYAPAVLSLTYDFTKLGNLQPYIGAGVNYTVVYNEKDLLLNDLAVDNGLGSVIQIGADYDLGNSWTVGLDIRKIFVSVDAKAGSPLGDVSVDLELDPLIVFLSFGKKF